MKRKKCQTRHCRNDAARTHCHKCRSRRYAVRHPLRYHFNALKQNAKRRGHAFHLTFEQFKNFWARHPKEWKEKLAPGLCCWHIDRIDPRIGYRQDNIQILEKTKNVLKYHEQDKKLLLQVSYMPKHSPATAEVPAPF